jgi:putative transposon-encoded protein
MFIDPARCAESAAGMRPREDNGAFLGDMLSRSKIVVFGEAMLKKKVTSSGHSGRVYLQPGWVGCRVKIIRVD